MTLMNDIRPLTVVAWCCVASSTHAFVRSSYLFQPTSSAKTSLNLIPLASVDEFDSTFFASPFDAQGNLVDDGSDDSDRNDDDADGSNLQYTLSIVEEQDLPDLSRFVVSCFGADAIRLSQNMNEMERFLLSPATDLLNGYSSIVAFAEVLSGIKQRTSRRMRRGNAITSPLASADCSVDDASQDSLILAVGRSKVGSEWQTDIIATIELRLQPCDAKIPFTLPSLDRLERRLASLLAADEGNNSNNSNTENASSLKPYLSNLCVSDEYRGKRIGRALVQCVEYIASDIWSYDTMYLHVDEDNAPALGLYVSEGYEDVVGKRWNPGWAGDAVEIGYFKKKLEAGGRKKMMGRLGKTASNKTPWWKLS